MEMAEVAEFTAKDWQERCQEMDNLHRTYKSKLQTLAERREKIRGLLGSAVNAVSLGEVPQNDPNRLNSELVAITAEVLGIESAQADLQVRLKETNERFHAAVADETAARVHEIQSQFLAKIAALRPVAVELRKVWREIEDLRLEGDRLCLEHRRSATFLGHSVKEIPSRITVPLQMDSLGVLLDQLVDRGI
jgi:predicted  nucleic acid-binding Zn-ribbon protein